MNWLLIFLGGGLGSLARYGTGILTVKIVPSTFPLGTFVSNIFACLILVLISVWSLTKFPDQTWIQPLLITGFCGGYSTFSTFSNETAILMQQGNYLIAVLNILLSLIVGIGLIFWIQQSSN